MREINFRSFGVIQEFYSLNLLMNESILPTDINTFYKLYFRYIEDKQPYPADTIDELERNS